MYVIINEETNTARVTNHKTAVANLIGVHRNTVINNLRKSNPTSINGFTIYEATYIKGKVTKGNTDSMRERQRKARKKEGYDD